MSEKRQYIDISEVGTNHYKLFHQVFMVKVRYIDLIDLDVIKRYGHPTHGDEEDDRKNVNEKITVGLTIPKLVELMKKRTTFWLTNNTNEHLIYKIIHTHICEWSLYASKNRHLGRMALDRIPYQDLKDLSDLAIIMYKNRDRSKDNTLSNLEEIKIDTENQMDFLKSIMVDDFNVPTQEEKTEEIIPHLSDMSVLSNLFERRK